MAKNLYPSLYKYSITCTEGGHVQHTYTVLNVLSLHVLRPSRPSFLENFQYQLIPDAKLNEKEKPTEPVEPKSKA